MQRDTIFWINKVYEFLGVGKLEALKPVSTNLANPGKYERAEFIPMSDGTKRHLVSLCEVETEKLSELSGIDLGEVWNLAKYA